MSGTTIVTGAEIVERDVPEQWIAGIRTTGRYSDCGPLFKKLCRRLGRHMAGMPFLLHYSCEYRENDADFEACIPLRKQVEAEGIDVRSLPAARCVVLEHRGPYETLRESYDHIRQYVEQKAYEVELPTREVYLKGPGVIFRGNPKKYITEILLPIQQ